MLAVDVIDDPAAAMIALEPVRSRLLSELAEPASAATLAAITASISGESRDFFRGLIRAVQCPCSRSQGPP